MGWFSNKPAFVALCPFLAGLVFAYYFNFPFLPLSVVALVMLGLGFIFHCKKIIVQLLLMLLLFLIGCLHLESRSFESGPNSIQHFADLPYTVTVEGLVLKPAEKSGRSWTTIIRADSVWVLGAGYRTQGLCLLKIYEKPDIHYGDRIVSKGQLRLPAGQRNPGAFNYKKYLAAQNIHAVLRVVSSEHIVRLDGDNGRPILAGAVYSVRKFILSAIDSSLSDQPAALLKALLVGARGDLDEELLPAFANVGVIHVLAVSGLHVGFILAGLLGFLRFLRIPDPARLFIVIIGLIFYAHLTGLKPSVVRATIMAVVYLVGLLLQRRAHLLNTLAVAAFIILVRRPLELFEPGFQLSFMAVAGIIFIYHRLSKLLRTRTKRLREKGQVLSLFLLNLFFVSVAAQIATIPLTVYYFHRLSLIAFFANLIIIPLIAVVVALGMIALLFSSVSLLLGAIYFNTVWLLLQGIITFVVFFQNIPMAYLVLPRPSILVIAIYFSCVALFVVWRHGRMRKFLIFFILMLLNVRVWSTLSIDNGLKITFFDVGQGDAVLFEFPNGKTMLVDAGDRNDYFNCGESIIYPYLVRYGIRKIDVFLLSHAHNDHIGGALTLLEKKYFKRIVKTHVQENSRMDVMLEEMARRFDVPVHYVQVGDTLCIDPEVLLLVLHPTPGFIKNAAINSTGLNDASIVFKCIYHNHAILMTGDAEIPSEQSMLRYDALLSSSLVKLAHHGSHTAGSPLFRRAVGADVGIVSVAAFNRFGLPSKHLLQSYEKEGTDIFMTSEHGAIQFLIKPDSYERIVKKGGY